MGIKHYVRVTAPSSIPVKERKAAKWLAAPGPGPHKKGMSISAVVLLRDFLGVAKTSAEAQYLMNAGGLEIDGKKIKDKKFPVGLMDIIHLPSEKKHYAITIINGKMTCVKLASHAKKYCKITKKYAIEGGKLKATTHDGRQIFADKDTRVGDTVLLEVPSGKVLGVIKRKEGARCIVTSGKHAGAIGLLGKTMERKGSMGAEAEVIMQNGKFTTVLDYVFIIDENFKVE